MRSTKMSTTGASVRSTSNSIQSSGTVRTQGTFRVHMDDPVENIPVLVKKKKSRLALDLGWALGDRTNKESAESYGTPTSQSGSLPSVKEKSNTGKLALLKKKASNGRLSPDGSSDDKENVGKEKWKWSMAIGRGRKDGSPKEALPAKIVKGWSRISHRCAYETALMSSSSYSLVSCPSGHPESAHVHVFHGTRPLRVSLTFSR